MPTEFTALKFNRTMLLGVADQQDATGLAKAANRYMDSIDSDILKIDADNFREDAVIGRDTARLIAENLYRWQVAFWLQFAVLATVGVVIAVRG